MRNLLANVEGMRRGSVPMPEEVAAALREDDMSMDECAELLQSMIEDGLGQRATALATSMHHALKGHGATDYVEAIKIMAAQKSH